MPSLSALHLVEGFGTCTLSHRLAGNASPTCVSRRQQGQQTEFGLLPDNVKEDDVVQAATIDTGTMTSYSHPALVVQQPSDPQYVMGHLREIPKT